MRIRMLLSGSRAADHASVAELLELARAGSQATYVRADLTTADGARALRQAAAGAVNVLFHLAGSLEPGRGEALKLAAVLRLEAIEPAATVLASSIAASLPGLERGLEAYAAANRALDDHARRPRRAGACEASRCQRCRGAAWRRRSSTCWRETACRSRAWTRARAC